MKIKTEDMTHVALFTVLIIVCTWISIPMTIPFTLQTFAIFLACLVLGGKLGLISVIVYIMLGIVGLPVFSGFRGGPGVLFGNTGGYIIGFIFTAAVMWLFETFFKNNRIFTFIAMISGMITYDVLGTAWFMLVYTKNNGSISLAAVLSMCVFPFIIPDLLKIVLAYAISERIKKLLPVRNVTRH